MREVAGDCNHGNFEHLREVVNLLETLQLRPPREEANGYRSLRVTDRVVVQPGTPQWVRVA